MEQLYTMAITVIISVLLSVGAYKLGCLTRGGALASFFVGAFVGCVASINAFILLTIFTVVGFAVTLKDFDRKTQQGVQEGRHGERTWKNVLGVGIPPCIVVAINALGLLSDQAFAIMFISTIAVAGADTVASEVGVKDPKAYMITTFKPTVPGTNGGVSVKGTVVSTIAAFLIALLGWMIIASSLSWLLIIPFFAGVIGNLLDSLFGAILENRGYISKYTNNASTAIIGALFGLGLFLLI